MDIQIQGIGSAVQELLIYHRNEAKCQNCKNKLIEEDLNDETLTQKSCCCKTCDQTCDQMTDFSFCFECKDVYCESCCEHHVQEAPSHTIFQVKHMETDSQSQKVCKHCIVKMKRCFTIPIPVDKLHVHDVLNRICGFVILDEERIVIADISDRVLRILSAVKTGKTFAPIILAGEPRGIARMFDSRFAVTFPYDWKIQIFDVKSEDPSNSVKDELDMHSYGKPFSITYNQDTFAVEIDEGEDGYILIMTIDGVCLHKIHQAKQYAFFTGNTIRLALDYASERLFISAMSKKAVTCLDFKGEKKWSKQFTSPRGLFFLQDLGKLILASRLRNAIYQLNTHNGNGKLLASCGDIKLPRYIAYDQRTKLLCVQAYGDDNEDRIVGMKYK